MALSTAQQRRHYRPMIAAAWRAHSLRNPNSEFPNKEEWYRAELLEATGVDSSLKLDPRKDLEIAMAHFEAIVGRDFYWQLRLFSGDARRILFKIRELSNAHNLDEDYVRGIAAKAIQRDPSPDLDTLVPKDLLNVLNGLRAHVRTIAMKVPF
jgi:hypothetical protein